MVRDERRSAGGETADPGGARGHPVAEDRISGEKPPGSVNSLWRRSRHGPVAFKVESVRGTELGAEAVLAAHVAGFAGGDKQHHCLTNALSIMSRVDFVVLIVGKYQLWNSPKIIEAVINADSESRVVVFDRFAGALDSCQLFPFNVHFQKGDRLVQNIV